MTDLQEETSKSERLKSAASASVAPEKVAAKRSAEASPIRKPVSDTKIQMRVPQQTRELIDSAAAVTGRSRTEFVLESARQKAVDVLLDQRVFDLDPEQSLAVAMLLSNPPAPVEALKRLMTRKAPWQ